MHNPFMCVVPSLVVGATKCQMSEREGDLCPLGGNSFVKHTPER